MILWECVTAGLTFTEIMEWFPGGSDEWPDMKERYELTRQWGVIPISSQRNCMSMGPMVHEALLILTPDT